MGLTQTKTSPLASNCSVEKWLRLTSWGTALDFALQSSSGRGRTMVASCMDCWSLVSSRHPSAGLFRRHCTYRNLSGMMQHTWPCTTRDCSYSVPCCPRLSSVIHISALGMITLVQRQDKNITSTPGLANVSQLEAWQLDTR